MKRKTKEKEGEGNREEEVLSYGISHDALDKSNSGS